MKWESLKALANGRYKHSMFSFNNKIYVFGGQYKTQINTNYIEVYDVKTKLWETIKNK